MQKPNYSAEKIEHFEKMFQAALEYAGNCQLPITVVESACRDTLARIDAKRLLDGLRASGAKV